MVYYIGILYSIELYIYIYRYLDILGYAIGPLLDRTLDNIIALYVDFTLMRPEPNFDHGGLCLA